MKGFLANEGSGNLPLPGVVPDMKSDTESFISLQKVYRQKARDDIDAVKKYLDIELLKAGRQTDAISQDTLSEFCKNASFLSVTRYRSLSQEYKTDPQSTLVSRHLQDLEDNLVIYILLRACDKFKQTHHRFPGSHADDVDGDVGTLKKLVGAVLGEIGVSGHASVPYDWVHELYVSLPPSHILKLTITITICNNSVRAGSSELHNMAGILGGIASQEIIKLVTGQYVTMNNTLLFNGIKASVGVYAL